ncbi:MAG: hypothetical protein N3A38_12045, partial [Planctomycetota bacterium]|nr:hypothetical protein [Planctomycetota bacterium]
MRPKALLMAAMLAAGSLLPHGAAIPGEGQTPQPQQEGRSPLAARQENVANKMSDLDARMARLADILKRTEPEHAARLVEGVRVSREAMIRGRMERICKAIEKGYLSEAGDEQDRVIGDLKKLLEILTEDKSEMDRLREEIRRLEDWLRKVQNLATEEKIQKRETDKVSDPQAAIRDIDA